MSSGREVVREKLDRLIPLVGQESYSLGAGTVDRATTTSGVKVAEHPVVGSFD